MDGCRYNICGRTCDGSCVSTCNVRCGRGASCSAAGRKNINMIKIEYNHLYGENRMCDNNEIFFMPKYTTDSKQQQSQESVEQALGFIGKHPGLFMFSISLAYTALTTAKNMISNIVVGENKFGDVKLGEKIHDNIESLLWSRIKITNTDIIIKGINFSRFMQNINDLYEEKRLTGIFDPKYKMFEEFKYKKKLISRKKEMRIKNLRFKKFFILEVYNLFTQLYGATGYRTYWKIAKLLLKKTFLNNFDQQTKVVEQEPLSSNVKTELKNNPLLPHQAEFIQKYKSMTNILGLRGIILSFDQGLGKTLTSLALAKQLDKKQVVIACLKSTAVTTWGDEIRNRMSSISEHPENRSKIFVFGDKPDRYGTYNKSKNEYIVCNFESLDKIVNGYIDYSKDTLLIIDECQNFRTLEGKRWATLYSIINKFTGKLDVLPMSGTPIKARPSEIVPSLMCIDETFDEECAKIYAKCFNIDSTNIGDIINQRFGLVIYRKLKEDTLSLPKKTIITSYYKTSNSENYYIDNIKQSVDEAFDRHYDALKAEIVPYKERYEHFVNKYCDPSVNILKKHKYLNYLNATVMKEKRVYLHELTSQEFESFGKDHIIPNITDKAELEEFIQCQTKYVRIHNSAMSKAVGEVYPPRIAKMFCSIIDDNEDAIVDKILGNDAKVCLFASRLETIERLEKLCKDHDIGFVTITGKNLKQRPELVYKFRNDDEIDVLIAMNTTMGTGVTLIEADYEMVFGTPWRKSDLDQMSDRIHRIGQTKDCTIDIVGLSTPGYKNLFDRMEDILMWSDKMTNSYIDGIEGIAEM